MMPVPSGVKIFIANTPADMRKNFDGLSGLVRSNMKLNPLSGYLFVFFNKNRNRVKILFWDNDGYALYYKRLEKGRFKRPAFSCEKPCIDMTSIELSMVLAGIDLQKTRKQKRFILDHKKQ